MGDNTTRWSVFSVADKEINLMGFPWASFLSKFVKKRKNVGCMRGIFNSIVLDFPEHSPGSMCLIPLNGKLW